jgi:hypothetical protein
MLAERFFVPRAGRYAGEHLEESVVITVAAQRTVLAYKSPCRTSRPCAPWSLMAEGRDQKVE